MRARACCALLIAAIVFTWLAAGSPMGSLRAAGPASIRGKITAKDGPLEGAYVGAHREGTTITSFIMTNEKGEFTFRGVRAGTYGVYTRIPGFHKVVKDKVVVRAGDETRVDFQVAPETDFMTLVSQATNSELLESLPLTKQEKLAIDSRCSSRCHGISYVVSSRFSAKDWKLIVSKMTFGGNITAVGDIDTAPKQGPLARTEDHGVRADSHVEGDKGEVSDAGDYLSVRQKGTLNDDQHLIEYCTKLAGPESKGFPIHFQPRATGKLTRAAVTEFQIPRPGAYIHDLLVDPRGRYIWYNDWRKNVIGRLDINSGEIKEFPIPSRDDRPGGAHNAKWDQFGNIWIGQLWSGQAVRFNTNALEGKAWAVPLEWTRTGSVVVCPTMTHPDGPVWVTDGFSGKTWTLNPDTGKLTEVQNARWSVCDSQGNLWGMRPGVLRKTEPGLQKFTEYPTPTPKAVANENRLNPDSAGNIWYGDWSDGHIAYLDVKAGKIREFRIPSPWALAYNAIGDGAHNIGWTVPHMSDRVVKADANTGEVTEFPLPSNGYQIRNLGIDLNSNPPAVWFPNEQDGTIVRFQEYAE